MTVNTVDEKRVKPEVTSIISGRWWQYRYQFKGPRTKKFDVNIPPIEDPYQSINFEDPALGPYLSPVFSLTSRVRVGEGNDITPDRHLFRRFGVKIKAMMTKLAILGSATPQRQKGILSSR